MKPYLRYGLLAGIALFTALVFVVDLVTRIGIGVWVFYLPVILSLVLFGDNRLIVFGATLCSVLVIICFFLSPHEPPPSGPRFLNRGMAILSIWLSAATSMVFFNRSEQLKATSDALQRVIDSHRATTHALRISEERWRLAMESGGVGTRDVDLRTCKEIWSPTQFAIFGYEPTVTGAATYEMWIQRLHPDDRPRILKAMAHARMEQALFHLEYRLSRPGQENPVWIEVFGRYYYNERDEAVRYIGVSFDITPRKNLEREFLEITARQQQEIGQELHDGVGQELTGLGLMAQTLVQRLPESATERRIANRLVAGITQAHQKIRVLSRGLIPVDIDSRGLSIALAELAHRTAEQTCVSVSAACPDWLELPDHTTATHMFRIAQEAVTNALRHGRPQQIHMTLLSDSHDLHLRIADDGIGIRHSSGQVAGLGLRIMKYRAGLIGGVLEVNPAERGGTVVTFTLPWGNRDGK